MFKSKMNLLVVAASLVLSASLSAGTITVFVHGKSTQESHLSVE
jgi:hypothetical protein